jgi:hypothetical protein
VPFVSRLGNLSAVENVERFRQQLDFGILLNRETRETRRSTYLIDGAWNALFGNSEKRSEPFEPFTPPAGLVPNTAEVLKLFVTGVKRNPENILTIGAIVQPFRIAFPTLLSLRLAKFVL